MVDLEEKVFHVFGIKKDFSDLYSNPAYEIYVKSSLLAANYSRYFKKNVEVDKLRDIFEFGAYTIKVVDLESDRDILKMNKYLSVFISPDFAERSDKISLLVGAYSKSFDFPKELFSVMQSVVKNSFFEREATNVRNYLLYRARVTEGLTKIISHSAKRVIEEPRYHEFLSEIFQVGDLLDSFVDFSEDSRRGEVNFQPSLKNRLFIGLVAGRELAKFLKRYPFVFRDAFGFVKDLNKIKY